MSEMEIGFIVLIMPTSIILSDHLIRPVGVDLWRAPPGIRRRDPWRRPGVGEGGVSCSRRGPTDSTEVARSGEPAWQEAPYLRPDKAAR